MPARRIVQEKKEDKKDTVLSARGAREEVRLVMILRVLHTEFIIPMINNWPPALFLFRGW